MGEMFSKHERRRRPLPRRPFAVLVGTLMAFGLVTSAARANVPFTTIDGTRPIRTVYLGNDLSCQVGLSVDDVFDFYPSATAPGDCGTFVSIGSTVYGPDFDEHDGSATPGSYTPYTAVSQSAPTGAGTASDPLRVTTVAQAGALTVTETTSYVRGADTIRTSVAATNGTGSPVNNVRVYRAGDCYLAGSDIGYGAVDGSGGVYCTASANNSPAGRLIGFVPQTPGSHYIESDYYDVWDQIDGTDFPDTADTDEYQDNGAGLSWALGSIAAGATSTVNSDLKVFAPDPYNGTTGVTLGSGESAPQLASDLSSFQVPITCNLPVGSLVPCDPTLTISAQLGASGNSAPQTKAATTEVLASAQVSVPAASTEPVTVPTSSEGQAALLQQKQLAAKAAKKAKKLKAQAKKANGAKAKKLKAKAKKAQKKAKKQAKLAKKLLVVTGQVQVVNERTGASETVPIQIAIP